MELMKGVGVGLGAKFGLHVFNECNAGGNFFFGLCERITRSWHLLQQNKINL